MGIEIMSEILREGYVYVQNRFAGCIRETDDGYEFQYDDAYLDHNPLAVSLTLPVQKLPYQSKILFPFFDGLIPEGWLLDIAEKNWKVPPQDRFGLLLKVCRDSIGDVRIEEEKL